jgi:secretion/DNA translocation related TadE-like protein
VTRRHDTPDPDARRLASGSGTAVGNARADRGSATIWVLAAGLLTMLVALASAAVGAAVVARHEAQAAADLAAFAGAVHALDPEASPCEIARITANQNRAELIACQVEGFDVLVTVEVAPAGFAALTGTARASTRAGPAAPDPGSSGCRAGPDAGAAGCPVGAPRVRQPTRQSPSPDVADHRWGKTLLTLLIR